MECDGRIEFPFGDGSQEVLYDWYHPDDYGSLDLHTALARSCNIYFWKVALRIWRLQGDRAREPAPELGQADGVRLHQRDRSPFEHDGLVPDRALFEDLAAEALIRNTGQRGRG